jgi:hypothetical protein
MLTQWIYEFGSSERMRTKKGRMQSLQNDSRFRNDGCEACCASIVKLASSNRCRMAVADRALFVRTRSRCCSQPWPKLPTQAWRSFETNAR